MVLGPVALLLELAPEPVLHVDPFADVLEGEQVRAVAGAREAPHQPGGVLPLQDVALLALGLQEGVQAAVPAAGLGQQVGALLQAAQEAGGDAVDQHHPAGPVVGQEAVVDAVDHLQHHAVEGLHVGVLGVQLLAQGDDLAHVLGGDQVHLLVAAGVDDLQGLGDLDDRGDVQDARPDVDHPLVAHGDQGGLAGGDHEVEGPPGQRRPGVVGGEPVPVEADPAQQLDHLVGGLPGVVDHQQGASGGHGVELVQVGEVEGALGDQHLAGRVQVRLGLRLDQGRGEQHYRSAAHRPGTAPVQGEAVHLHPVAQEVPQLAVQLDAGRLRTGNHHQPLHAPPTWLILCFLLIAFRLYGKREDRLDHDHRER